MEECAEDSTGLSLAPNMRLILSSTRSRIYADDYADLRRYFYQRLSASGSALISVLAEGEMGVGEHSRLR